MRLIAFSLLALSAAHAEVVVSNRYFKAEGTSHWHLYLHDDNGKVIRQLTSPENAHDVSPVFTKDGKSIVFIRKAKAGDRWMRIAKTGGKPVTLDGKPGWWDAAIAVDEPAKEKKEPEVVKRELHEYCVYSTPDVTTKVIIHRGYVEYDEKKPVEAGWLVRDGKEIPFSSLPGFNEYFGQTDHEGAPFLKTSAPQGATFHAHHDSTTGTSLQVIDLKNPRVITLSENWGSLYFPETGPGFYCVCQDRYQPLPGTSKTVNCLYLDYWDAEFRRTRFANRLGILAGASVRVRGQKQLNIPGRYLGGTFTW